MKILDLPSNTCLDSSERRGEEIQMAEVPGSVLSGVTVCCWIFFPHSKARDANIVIIANFGYFVKNSNEERLGHGYCTQRFFSLSELKLPPASPSASNLAY